MAAKLTGTMSLGDVLRILRERQEASQPINLQGIWISEFTLEPAIQFGQGTSGGIGSGSRQVQFSCVMHMTAEGQRQLESLFGKVEDDAAR